MGPAIKLGSSDQIFCMKLIFLLVVWMKCSVALDVITPAHICNKSNLSLIRECPYNGYIYNPHPFSCKDRYICYRTLKEPCDHETAKCKEGLSCVCGICQNCNDTDCSLELCPAASNEIIKRWIKRFERNLLDYNA